MKHHRPPRERLLTLSVSVFQKNQAYQTVGNGKEKHGTNKGLFSSPIQHEQVANKKVTKESNGITNSTTEQLGCEGSCCWKNHSELVAS